MSEVKRPEYGPAASVRPPHLPSVAPPPSSSAFAPELTAPPPGVWSPPPSAPLAPALPMPPPAVEPPPSPAPAPAAALPAGYATLESWAAQKGTEAVWVQAAAAMHGIPQGAVLAEGDYDAAVDAAQNVTVR